LERVLKLRKIAVTGGLSCGKSQVCRFFKDLGAYVVSADDVVHQLLSPKTSIGQQVIALLGSDIVNADHIDRSAVASHVFQNPDLLAKLEALLHPAVKREIDRHYQEACHQAKASLFVAEIPLLFETGAQEDFDYTIAVIADPEACKERFKQTTGYGQEEFSQRMKRQMSPDEKAALADFTLTNNGSLNDLEKTVKTYYANLTKPTPTI